MQLSGKVAVVTGGASGIGFASAGAMAARGMKLVIADIEEAALEVAVTQLRQMGADVIGKPTDVSDRASVVALADCAWSHFGAVHVLFNNAGVAVFGPTQEMSHADWQWSIAVNLWGPVHGVEVFVPRIIEQKDGGHLLFTASFAGLVPNRELGPYSVTKSAVVALAECLQKDLRQHGIGVSVLCPMRVTTNIDQSYRNRPCTLGGPEARQTYKDAERAALVGRELSPAEVAQLVMRGMQDNELYIQTHQEARPFVRRRWERIDDGFAKLE